jgi:hypothetical protein
MIEVRQAIGSGEVSALTAKLRARHAPASQADD